jgi:hypothetical protein
MGQPERCAPVLVVLAPWRSTAAVVQRGGDIGDVHRRPGGHGFRLGAPPEAGATASMSSPPRGDPDRHIGGAG